MSVVYIYTCVHMCNETHLSVCVYQDQNVCMCAHGCVCTLQYPVFGSLVSSFLQDQMSGPADGPSLRLCVHPSLREMLASYTQTHTTARGLIRAQQYTLTCTLCYYRNKFIQLYKTGKFYWFIRMIHSFLI